MRVLCVRVCVSRLCVGDVYIQWCRHALERTHIHTLIQTLMQVWNIRLTLGTYPNVDTRVLRTARFRCWSFLNDQKSEIFKPSRFEPLYQPYFDFWLFAWSRCGRIVKKSSRKDSLYQDYSVLLTSAPPSGRRQPSAFCPTFVPNIWKQAGSILVEITINQNIEVLLFW